MNYEHETKLRCILTIMGIITVCTACIVQKDPVDNSDDSGTKKSLLGNTILWRDGVKVIIPEMKNMYMWKRHG